jgi:hypothetical protein
MDRLRAWIARSGPGDEADDDRIRHDGFPGRGTVVERRPTGRTHRDRSEVELVLDVYLGRSRTFRVTIRPWVTAAEIARLEPGRAVPVAADHAEPGHVVLALDMDEARSIAGLGPVAGGPGGPKPPEGVDPDRPGPDAGR